MGALLVVLGILGMMFGGLGWLLAYQKSRRAELESMTDVQRIWYEAEAAYRRTVKNAEKGQKNTAHSEAKNVRSAQQALAAAEQVGTRRIGGGLIGPVRLWENRVEVGGVVFSFDDGPVTTRVDATLPSKTGNKQDPGSTVISVSGPQGSASASLAYRQLKATQALASTIVASSEAWPSLKKSAADGVAKAAAALSAIHKQESVALDEASSGVEAAKADRAAVEAARKHVPTAFCPKCNRNVAITDNFCPEGHGELLAYQPDNFKPVRAAARPKRGVRIGQLAVAGGAALFMLSAAFASPQQSTVVDSESARTPKASATSSRFTGRVTTTETIPFETEKRENGDRKEGEKITLSAGIEGVKKVTYKKYEDGRKVSEKETIISRPTTEVVEVGTKTQAQFDAEAKYAEAITLINQGDFIGASSALQQAINLAQLPAAKAKQAEIAPQLAAAQKDLYKKQCQNMPYNQLDKDADKLIGTQVHYFGQIFNIDEGSGKTVMQVNVTNNGWDIWTDQVMVVFDGSVDAYKDDKVNFWGEVAGTQNYESQAGWNMSAPKVEAKYVEK